MLSVEGFALFLTSFTVIAAIGWKWGTIERTIEITLDEVFKE